MNIFWGKRGAKVVMGSFVAQTVFVIKNEPPALPKYSQWSKNDKQMSQRSPRVWNKFKIQAFSKLGRVFAQGVSGVSKRPSGLREAPYKKIPICLLEKPKLLISMISGIWARHQAPKPTLFIFGDTRTSQKEKEKHWNILGKYYFCKCENHKLCANLEILNISKTYNI